MRSTVAVKNRTKNISYISRKVAFKVSLQRLYALSFPIRKEVLYELVKNVVKTRKEDPYAFFTASLRTRKFRISCFHDLFHSYFVLSSSDYWTLWKFID